MCVVRAVGAHIIYVFLFCVNRFFNIQSWFLKQWGKNFFYIVSHPHRAIAIVSIKYLYLFYFNFFWDSQSDPIASYKSVINLFIDVIGIICVHFIIIKLRLFTFLLDRYDFIWKLIIDRTFTICLTVAWIWMIWNDNPNLPLTEYHSGIT